MISPESRNLTRMKTLNVDDESVHGQEPERVHGVHDELVSAPQSEREAASGQLPWETKLHCFCIHYILKIRNIIRKCNSSMINCTLKYLIGSNKLGLGSCFRKSSKPAKSLTYFDEINFIMKNADAS